MGLWYSVTSFNDHYYVPPAFGTPTSSSLFLKIVFVSSLPEGRVGKLFLKGP